MNPLVYVCVQVGLLKDVLEAWRREVDKKPASMTAEQAFAALGLEPGQDEAAVRKAYYRLAQQYHPDKNPDGRVSATRCYCALNHYFGCRLCNMHLGIYENFVVVETEYQSASDDHHCIT